MILFPSRCQKPARACFHPWRILFVSLLMGTFGGAEVPDLTKPEVAQKVDRKRSTYNLGPTGLRGYIHVSRRRDDGADGTMTEESRQILVTVASAPADKVLQVDDVLLGVAWGGRKTAVPAFQSDARKAFGNAITEAEKKENGGVLRIKRWRAGKVQDVSVRLPVLGTYAESAPFDCAKSAVILANARGQFVGKLRADPDFLSRGHPWARPVHALALMSAVRPEDPDFTFVQSRVQAYARSLLNPEFIPNDGCMWTIGHQGIFLGEYYLATADPEVLPAIRAYLEKLAGSMSIFGTCNHRPALPRNDGSGRRSVRGYGAVNSAALPANLAMVMLRKALVASKEPVPAEAAVSIARGAKFYSWFVDKGGIPYGEHPPWLHGHSSNGKNACAAVFYSQLDDRPKETEYYTRWSVAAFNSREYGHTGQGFSYLWEGMGANVGGPEAVAAYFKPVRWHLDLSRRSDGSFAYDGQEQYGGGSTDDGTYLGKSSYYDLEATAIYLLTHSLPYQRLHITGKDANPAHELSSSQIADAIAAGNHRKNRSQFTISELIAQLAAFDPVVRESAAEEISTRELKEEDLAALRAMLDNPDSRQRRSACEVLSMVKDTGSIPRIARLLDKSVEQDAWVRAGAARAMRNYGELAKSEVPAMLGAFVKNAADPDTIDWSQPTQASNGELSFSLFEPHPGTRHFTFKDAVTAADRDLRVAAVRTAIQHPDSAVRSTAANFVFDSMPAEELLMMPVELIDLILHDTQSSRMWSDPGRQAGIQTLAKHRFFELLTVGLKMSVPTQEFWHSKTSEAAIREIANYGEAARWTLPGLRDALGQWETNTSQHKALLKTIETVDAATTSPDLRFLHVRADTQVVGTGVDKPIEILLTGTSPRDSHLAFATLTPPSHGTLAGTSPNLTYTPNPGYRGPDQFTFQAKDSLTTSMPATIAIVVGTAGNGLRGEYFLDPDFQKSGFTRVDPKLDFTWSEGSPGGSIPPGAFSVKWTGTLLIPETTTYTFSVLNSDGLRVTIDGIEAIAGTGGQPPRWLDSKPMEFERGRFVPIEIFYRHGKGPAAAKLKWRGPSVAGIKGDIIPAIHLFDGTPTGP